MDSASDAGDSIHQGRHQRCWVHCLWDVHEIKKQFPEDERLLTWARNGKAIYDETVVWATQDPGPRFLTPARSGSRVTMTCLRAAAQTPHQILCTYVEIPAVPAHNNLAERSVCHLVIAHKFSGGSRRSKGSVTSMRLAGHFDPWIAQKSQPFLPQPHVPHH